MADGKHTAPSAGGKGPKPAKAECAVRTSSGTILWKATAKLFGVNSGNKS